MSSDPLMPEDSLMCFEMPQYKHRSTNNSANFLIHLRCIVTSSNHKTCKESDIWQNRCEQNRTFFPRKMRFLSWSQLWGCFWQVPLNCEKRMHQSEKYGRTNLLTNFPPKLRNQIRSIFSRSIDQIPITVPLIRWWSTKVHWRESVTRNQKWWEITGDHTICDISFNSDFWFQSRIIYHPYMYPCNIDKVLLVRGYQTLQIQLCNVKYHRFS